MRTGISCSQTGKQVSVVSIMIRFRTDIRLTTVTITGIARRAGNSPPITQKMVVLSRRSQWRVHDASRAGDYPHRLAGTGRGRRLRLPQVLVGCAQVYAALPGNIKWAGNCPNGDTISPLTYGGSTGTWMDEVADSFVHEMFGGDNRSVLCDYLDQSGTGYQDYVSPPPLAAGGVENEDIGQNVYGNKLLTTPSGRPANIKLGNEFYLIQSAFTMS